MWVLGPRTLIRHWPVQVGGRPEGGLAILWRKDLQLKINSIFVENNFIVFSFSIYGFDVVLINVYLNSDIWEAATLNKYLESLSKLEYYLDTLNYDCIFLLGDFNADPFYGRAWQNLNDFAMRNFLKCFDVDMLDDSSYTFVGYGNSVSKWLDHVLGKGHKSIKIDNVRTLQNIFGSDHLPLVATLRLNDKMTVRPPVTPFFEKDQTYIRWDKLNEHEIDEINNTVDAHLHDFSSLPIHDCCRTGCRDPQHLHMIDECYDHLISIIQSSSEKYLKRSIKKNKFKVIPGWNRCVKKKHRIARDKYLNWINQGRLRGTSFHQEMLSTRHKFKEALNECKNNEHKEICKSIAEKFYDKDKSNFWNDIKKKRYFNKLPNVIDGHSGDSNINQVFYDNFLLNQPRSEPGAETDICNEIRRVWCHERKMCLRLSSITIRKLICGLNAGQGHDKVRSTFLKNASEHFLNNVALFYNACSNHCYLPGNLLKGTITPVLKDTKKNVTDSSNYRPVMQSSCLLKIFELHVLQVLSEKLALNFRQFGFKTNSSTTDACFILKEVMNKYCKHKRSSIATFIDLSKAFDRVDHFILGRKLLSCSIPVDIILLLIHYLRDQRANIMWKNSYSNYCFIEKGVRQGGILSPFLFNFYINSIINDISNTNVGCCLGDTRSNILANADDIVLLAENTTQMKTLYGKLVKDIEEHVLKINESKTKCVIFGHRNKELTESIELNGDKLQVVNAFKYLGHNICFNFKDTDDIAFRLRNCYASFNTVFRDFKSVDRNTILFLFKSFSLPDYGLPLWNHCSSFNSSIFKSFEIAFSKACFEKN